MKKKFYLLKKKKKQNLSSIHAFLQISPISPQSLFPNEISSVNNLYLKSLILTCIPKHEPLSHLPPHNISLGHPHAQAQACCILCQT